MASGHGETNASEGGFSETVARAALDEAAHTGGHDSTDAELIRIGTHAVFRLVGEPVIARVARSLDELPRVKREVRAARWLATEDFPTVRLAGSAGQPVTTAGGQVVTFWESVQDEIEYATVAELAELIRRLHWLEEPKSLGLLPFDPFAELEERFAGATGIPADDREWLRGQIDHLAKQYDRLDFVLPYGLLHGDANIGNVLRHSDGHAVLIDIDGFCLGHREWDLVKTGMYHDRFGWHTRAEYESFVRHYGFDVLNWPGYPVLADIHEAGMVLWVAGNAATNPAASDELAKRLRTLRHGGSRKDWSPL